MLDNLTILDGKAIARMLAKVEVKSALNPILWALAVLAWPSFYLVVKVPGWPAVFGAAVVTATMLLFAVAFVYFMLKHPELLRSETYQLERERMLLGHKGKVEEVSASVVPDAIPAPPKDTTAYLPAPGQED